MELKKKIIAIFLIILFLLCYVGETIAISTEILYIGSADYKEENGKITGYSIKIPNKTEKPINILKEFESSDEDSALKEVQHKIYCMKAGIGLVYPPHIGYYDVGYNMVEERDAISNHNELAYQIENSKQYDRIIALLSLLYVPGESSEEYREELLNKAMQKFSVEYQTPITDDDIDAINQALIWHYTNPNDSRYDLYNTKDWIGYTEDGETYELLSLYNEETQEGKDRVNQMEALYKYLLDTVELETISGYEVNDTCVVKENLEKEIVLREKPSIDAKIIKTLSDNENVTRIRREVANVNGYIWDKIKLQDGTEGFIESDSIQIVSENITCTVLSMNNEVVNLRSEPGNEEPIRTLEDGTVVTRVENRPASANNYVWDKVRLEDGTEGYVQKQFLRESTYDEANDICVATVFNKGTNINVREQATTASKVAFKISNADIVERIERNAGYADGYVWDKIKLTNGVEGYIITQNLEPIRENVPEYDIEKVVNEPITIEGEEILNYEVQDTNYVTGPITITKNSESYCKLQMEVKSGEDTINNYEILDSEGNTVEESKLIEGGEFYISVPVEGTKKLTINLSAESDFPDLNLVDAKENNHQQIAAVVQKEAKTETKQFKANIKEDKFDLALRKYITKVNDVELQNSRVPNIDKESLINGTTATYKHRKDAIEIETGDEIIYNITIYNEGTQKGRATEITDQLPEGIEFIEVVSGDYSVEEYNQETNRLKLKKNSENNLNAYKGRELAEETVSIKCKVTLKPNSIFDKVLTNVAWISKEYNAETNEEIVDEKGKDIDSEPETTPNVNKDNMENYKGNAKNKDTEEDENYFYKGMQDDDDFEKVVLKKKIFDLSLIKWVKEARVILNNQTSIVESGNSAQNARNENILKLEMAEKDINNINIKYVYTIKITNDGEVAGYADEITYYIPEGLKFVKKDNDEWNWQETSKGVVTTNYLSNKILQPGETAELQIILIWENGEENFGEKVNYAEITKDSNEYDLPDIDSIINNKKVGEDDIDESRIILAVKTGEIMITMYFGFALLLSVMFGLGVFAIKKYVLG